MHKEKYDDNTGKICCFFGHRDTCLNETDPFKKEIEKLILEKEVKTFFMGGYGNFDSYAFHILKEIKKEIPFIKIIYVIAYFSRLESYLSNVYDETL